MSKRKKYTPEFKAEAVRQVESRGTRTVLEVAQSLGVSSTLLHGWRKPGAVPVVSDRGDLEMARIARFGVPVRYEKGSSLFRAGEPAPGMFLLLSGTVIATQRDGLGHVTPITRHGPGEFIAEVGQLSGAKSLVDCFAEVEVETLLIAPEKLRQLIVAEAELGELISIQPLPV